MARSDIHRLQQGRNGYGTKPSGVEDAELTIAAAVHIEDKMLTDADLKEASGDTAAAVRLRSIAATASDRGHRAAQIKWLQENS